MDARQGKKEVSRSVVEKIISSGNDIKLLAGENIVAAPVSNLIKIANGEKMILEKSQYPLDLQNEVVKGVFVGGCVDRGEGSRFHAKAHAHTSGANKGWMCFLKFNRIKEPMLVKHELAHLLTDEGHNDKWRAKVLELGGTLDACNSVIDGKELLRSYQKRSR